MRTKLFEATYFSNNNLIKIDKLENGEFELCFKEKSNSTKYKSNYFTFKTFNAAFKVGTEIMFAGDYLTEK